MVDTIILYVNNLTEYRQVFEKFYSPSDKKNSFTVAVLDTATADFIETTKSSKYIYHDTDRVLPIAHRSNLFIPSSHYSLSYYVNLTRNRLEFNFSIPKYRFGTNVLQFIPWHSQNSEDVFDKLKKFITDFIKTELPQPVLFEDIEINRVDLCYNQIFDSKLNALSYLDEQKKLLTKFARSSKNNFRSYDTSLMYITKRYSFKIYHKGTEFAKNDYKEILKNGNSFKYDLPEMQKNADCILRYEMTFRKSMINYLFNQKFFESSEAVKSDKYNQSIYYEFGKEIINMSFQDIRKKYYSSDYERYKKIEKRFTLRSPFCYQSTFTEKVQSERITFDKIVFSLLSQEFKNKILSYQIECNLSPLAIKLKIDKFNEKIDKGYIKRENKANEHRLIMAAVLSQYINVESLKEIMPQRSFYRLKADLTKIGIKTQVHNLSIPTPRLDYLDYKILFGKYHLTDV